LSASLLRNRCKTVAGELFPRDILQTIHYKDNNMQITKMRNKAGQIALVEDFQKAEFMDAGYTVTTDEKVAQSGEGKDDSKTDGKGKK
jgi:hypothetical protein